MKFVLLVLAFFGSAAALSAQEDADRPAPHHQFEVRAAYAFGYWKDVMFSPLNYQTQGTAYQLSYQRENRAADAMFQVALEGSFGQIVPVRPDLAYFTSEYTAGNLTLGYLKRVPLKHDRLRFLLGPQYRLTVRYFDYRGQDSFTFVASHTLDAKGLLVYSAGVRHKITTAASVGLLGLLVRPPYAGYNSELLYNYENRPLRLIVDGGRLAALPTYQLLQWEVGYQFALTPHFSLSVRYAFDFQRVPDRYDPFVQALNQFGGGLTLTL